MKYLLSSLIVVFISACSIQTTVPYAQKYQLNELTIEKIDDNKTRQLTLKTSIPQSSNALLLETMYYTKANQIQGSFTQSRWAASPARQIAHLFESALIQSHLFKTVLSYQSNVDGDLALEINIIEFMQYFDADETDSYVSVKINLTLIDQIHRKVIDSAYFSTEVDVKTLNAQGGVSAYNKALENIITKAVPWIQESVDMYVQKN